MTDDTTLIGVFDVQPIVAKQTTAFNGWEPKNANYGGKLMQFARTGRVFGLPFKKGTVEAHLKFTPTLGGTVQVGGVPHFVMTAISKATKLTPAACEKKQREALASTLTEFKYTLIKSSDDLVERLTKCTRAERIGRLKDLVVVRVSMAAWRAGAIRLTDIEEVAKLNGDVYRGGDDDDTVRSIGDKCAQARGGDVLRKGGEQGGNEVFLAATPGNGEDQIRYAFLECATYFTSGTFNGGNYVFTSSGLFDIDGEFGIDARRLCEF